MTHSTLRVAAGPVFNVGSGKYMQIAIIGTGAIGSTFAFRLAKAGHDVTVIARGSRLAQLQADGAIVLENDDRAPVRVSASLDPTTPFDLVLVTVLAPQVDAVLPAVRDSAAKTVMFMHNTFEPLQRLQDAVGKERFAFGFPAVLATLTDGKLSSEVFSVGQITTVTDARWAQIFSAARIPTVAHDDMHSWLRTHAAFIMPFMALGAMVYERKRGVTFAEARAFATAIAAGFELVRSMGNTITPNEMVLLAHIPTVVVASIVWVLSRTKMVRGMGALGPGEARMLIDMMTNAAPGKAAALIAIRP